MKEVNYPPLKIVVTGNDKPVVLPPDRAEFDQLVGVRPSSDGFYAFLIFLLVLFDQILYRLVPWTPPPCFWAYAHSGQKSGAVGVCLFAASDSSIGMCEELGQ
jgi:hypothetical protein